uniref:AlNc14C86G5481 protein n=1 Tax=Albugo laibachii Nc14 TaxID=890382 RepID=F0WFU6_9STRA|nr:AlNc14C86G5481 [Albugo laibachii Nc14]|eukprot:CCA20080.1 AlNc14C86G5481 [Albugo laibachii Nc14]
MRKTYRLRDLINVSSSDSNDFTSDFFICFELLYPFALSISLYFFNALHIDFVRFRTLHVRFSAESDSFCYFVERQRPSVLNAIEWLYF